MKEYHYLLKQHYQTKMLLKVDPSTTKAYLENEEEDNQTIGDMIGDKLKNLKL